MFFSEVKNLEYLLVAFEPYSAEECCNRQFLLPVDICIHHIIDISGKFYPRSFERNYSCGIEFCPVCMHALAEEHTRGSMQPVSYTHLRAHETVLDLVCRL